ncbi:MAG: hypothetical protein ACKVPJ_09395 [Chitinophagales bacterium]
MEKILVTITKWISFASFFLLVFAFSIDLGYPAYILFGFLILYYATLLLFVIKYQSSEKKKKYLPVVFFTVAVLPILLLLIMIPLF